MNINFLTISLLFLFLPGLICAVLVAKLTTHRELKPTDFLIPSFIFGFLIFVGYLAIAKFWNLIFEDHWHLPSYNIFPQDPKISELEISTTSLGVAILIGFFVALIFSVAINKKLLHRFARKFGITRKFADRDVWSYIMNSDETDWLVVRDNNTDLYYLGKIKAFSDEEETREVILTETKVYDNISGSEKYHAGSVYFSFAKDRIILEFPDGE